MQWIRPAEAQTPSPFTPTKTVQASSLSPKTGTGSAVLGTSPTISTPNVVGVTDGSSATAGSVGENLRVAFSGVTATTSGQYQDAATLALTAGDWSCNLIAVSQFPFSTTTIFIAGLSTGTTGNTFSDDVFGDNDIEQDLSSVAAGNGRAASTIASWRVSLAAGGTLLVKIRYTYSGTAPTTAGRANCRRER